MLPKVSGLTPTLMLSYLSCFSLKSHRNFYDDLSDKLSMDPRAVIGDDPLSQDDEVTNFVKITPPAQSGVDRSVRRFLTKNPSVSSLAPCQKCGFRGPGSPISTID